MIGLLSGSIKEISENSVILFVNGIGFEVFVPKPENFLIDKTYTLYIYESVKENEISLYGFTDKSEKVLFDLIIKKVSGIGAKTAMNIFRALSKDRFIQVVESGDYKAFKDVPGIGTKTAKRIVVELGGELKTEEKKVESEKMKLVRSALISLGFDNEEIRKVLKELKDEQGTVEEIVRLAIKRLSNAK